MTGKRYKVKNISASTGFYYIGDQENILKAGEWVILNQRPTLYTAEISVTEM